MPPSTSGTATLELRGRGEQPGAITYGHFVSSEKVTPRKSYESRLLYGSPPPRRLDLEQEPPRSTTGERKKKDAANKRGGGRRAETAGEGERERKEWRRSRSKRMGEGGRKRKAGVVFDHYAVGLPLLRRRPLPPPSLAPLLIAVGGVV